MSKTSYVLSEYFAPFQSISSINFTKIAKYLAEDAGSELKKLMCRINCGWCYAEANHGADFMMLKDVERLLAERTQR